MAPMTETVQHHHRSTTKSNNKAFKSRHSTKSALKEKSKGKIESLEKGVRRTPHQQIMSKIERRNHAKQIRQNKLESRREEASIFAGRDGAPRIIAVVPLCRDLHSSDVVRSLNSSVDVSEASTDEATSSATEISRFKQKVQYLTPARELMPCLDSCRLADFVLFVLSAEEEVDELGEQLLRCIESQGVSTVFTGVWGLGKVEPAKKRPDVLKSLKSFITHFFAAQEKVHDLTNRQDCSNVMRSLCTLTPKGIRWREDRSWMHVDQVQWQDSSVVLTGVVRGRGLKADRLVQVGDWGDFQVDKITAAPLTRAKKNSRSDEMAVDEQQEGEVLEHSSEDQDDLAELAPETAMEDIPAASLAPSERKAVLLDDHHYFHKDDHEQLAVPKKLPRGTSKYQAAWFLGDMSDDGSDLEDLDDDMLDELNGNEPVAAGPADGVFDETMREPTEFGGPSEYPQSEAFFDKAPEDEADDIEAYRKQRRDEAEDDLEFPDEIELHPNVSAQERLARYRGLKNFRTSDWNTGEDKAFEPEEWSRLLEIADYKSAKNRVLKEAMHGGVKPGTRVNVHVRLDPEQLSSVKSLPSPTALFSLLRHEHKRSCTNASLTLSSEFPAPLKSKEQLIMQCGPRRILITPLFSQVGNTPNNVHKFDRYLHPGRTGVATFIGPLVWGSVPCLYFRQPTISEDAVDDLAKSINVTSSSGLELIGTGTTLPASTDRVIAKRIILTGHPFKIHKKMVTVRYMFFNSEDVNYFRALQLWTKRGRSGFIKEPLGTHGYFKATFDGKINPLDSVAISLYKRVWPRSAVIWRPGMEEEAPELVDGMTQ